VFINTGRIVKINDFENKKERKYIKLAMILYLRGLVVAISAKRGL
tara:strand:- start:610 stop:744 length:135 start_codon:yes stop_codon:yes gene_type:complete